MMRPPMSDKKMIEALKSEVEYWRSEAARFEMLHRLNCLEKEQSRLGVSGDCIRERVTELVSREYNLPSTNCRVKKPSGRGGKRA